MPYLGVVYGQGWRMDGGHFVVVARLAKLGNRSVFRRALGEFGVPAEAASPLGVQLPLAELAVAGALVPTAWWEALLVGRPRRVRTPVAGPGSSQVCGPTRMGNPS